MLMDSPNHWCWENNSQVLQRWKAWHFLPIKEWADTNRGLVLLKYMRQQLFKLMQVSKPLIQSIANVNSISVLISTYLRSKPNSEHNCRFFHWEFQTRHYHRHETKIPQEILQQRRNTTWAAYKYLNNPSLWTVTSGKVVWAITQKRNVHISIIT